MADKTPDIVILPQKVKQMMQQCLYYYSKLSSDEKSAYTILKNNIRQNQPRSDCLGDNIDIKKVLYAVLFDNPLIFFTDTHYHTYQSERGRGIELTFLYPPEVINNKISHIRVIAQEIAAKISEYDELRKVMYLHDYLAENVCYAKDLSQPSVYTIVGALLEHCCACSGYANAFKYLCDMVGITCIYVLGKAAANFTEAPHAWNIVQMNRKPYHIDVTYDKPIIGKEISREYFLLSDREIFYDREPNSMFPLPKCPVDGGFLKTFGTVTGLLEQIRRDCLEDFSVTQYRLSTPVKTEDLQRCLTNDAMLHPLLYARVKNVSYLSTEYSCTLSLIWKNN